MKRSKQSSIFSFVKREKTEKLGDTNAGEIEGRPSTSNASDDAVLNNNINTNENELSEGGAIVIDNDNNLRNATSCVNLLPDLPFKYDIGNFVLNKPQQDVKKVEILKNIWQPDSKYEFPTESSNCGKFKRRFQMKWLDNFKWLAYSNSAHGAFCKYCVLFLGSNTVGKGSHEKVGVLVSRPSKKLKDSLDTFRNHEKANYHRNAMLTADSVISILDKKQETIADKLNVIKKEETMKNRERLKPIIQTVRLCGRQQIPLRGHRDSGRITLDEPDQNDGNFRSILRYRVLSGDDILKEHLLSSSANALYASSIIQNEIVNIFGQSIQHELIGRIKRSGVFSVLADETTDIARIQQFSLCIRYVDVDVFKLREDFLTFVPVFDVTGLGLANTIQETLTNFGLDLNNLCGQGYDGCSAMRGQFRGVQAIMREKYPKAVYTHCVSHTLNLCLSDSCKVREIQNALGIIREVCSFFHSSPKRVVILKKHIAQLKPETTATKLKMYCETRWVERHEAILLFKDLLSPTVSALEEINTSSDDGDCITKTNGLLNAICNFSFLVAMSVLSKIMGISYHLSEYLQRENIDLVNALDKVEEVSRNLKKIRTEGEKKFDDIFSEVKCIAAELNVDVSTPRVCGFHRNRSNVPFSTPLDYYRRSVFIPFVDDLISSLDERFLNHKQTTISLQHLLPSRATKSDFSSIKDAAKFYENFLDTFPDSLEGEWGLWKQKWSEVVNEERPTYAISALASCDKDLFPTIFKLLHVLSVLPISTATPERTFSMLRRLKSYLRNTISEDRLVGLSLMNIHRDIHITDEKIIDIFASEKR